MTTRTTTTATMIVVAGHADREYDDDYNDSNEYCDLYVKQTCTRIMKYIYENYMMKYTAHTLYYT